MDRRVGLNVGGTRFETTRDTLCKYEGSYFCTLLSERWLPTDDDLFIDRDPVTFAYVLSFLRGYPVTADEDALRALHVDAVFYGLTELTETLRRRLGWRTAREELDDKKRRLEQIAAMRIIRGDDDDGCVGIDSDMEEIEGKLADLEGRCEDDVVTLRAEMLLRWAPCMVQSLCPLIERRFGVDMSGFVITRDYLPLLKDFVRYYRDKETFGPMGEILIKFAAEAYHHSLPETRRKRGLFSSR